MNCLLVSAVFLAAPDVDSFLGTPPPLAFTIAANSGTPLTQLPSTPHRRARTVSSGTPLLSTSPSTALQKARGMRLSVSAEPPPLSSSFKEEKVIVCILFFFAPFMTVELSSLGTFV